MQLDLSKLIADKPIAVHFNSYQQAKTFFDEMERQYPKVVRSWTKPYYEERYVRDGGVCYCPYLSLLKDGIASMTHGSRYTYEINRGFKVIEFEDLTYDVPELETNPVDLQIEFFLGI